MARLKCCNSNKYDVNPISAIQNFMAACFIVCAIFGEWLVLESTNDDNSTKNISKLHFVKHSLNGLDGLNEEFTIKNCTSIGSQLFLLPAKFTSITRNKTNHILYHYDELVYMDCITPQIANYFYFITAFCFVVMIVTTFGALLNSTSPTFQFFTYLRVISALEIIVGAIIALIILLLLMAKTQVEQLQKYSGENKRVLSGNSIYWTISCGLLVLTSAVMSQLRQRRIRMVRKQENKRLMCTRPLRSRRDIEQNEYDPQPIAELERYLLEPGLREPSISTISTAFAEDAPINEHEMQQLIT